MVVHRGPSHLLPKLTIAKSILETIPNTCVVVLSPETLPPHFPELFPQLFHPSRFLLLNFPAISGQQDTPNFPASLRDEMKKDGNRIKAKTLRAMSFRADYPFFEQYLYDRFMILQPDLVITGYLNAYWACDASARAFIETSQVPSATPPCFMVELGLKARDWYPDEADVMEGFEAEGAIWLAAYKREFAALQAVRAPHLMSRHPADAIFTTGPEGWDDRPQARAFPFSSSFPPQRRFVGSVLSINRPEKDEGDDDVLSFLDGRTCNVYFAYGSLMWPLLDTAQLARTKGLLAGILEGYPDCGLIVSVPDDLQSSISSNTGEFQEKNRVLLRAWLPQRVILRHPSVLFFASHCGYSSIVESLSEKTPILPVPIRGDQPENALALRTAGIAPLIVNIHRSDGVLELPPLEWWRSNELLQRMEEIYHMVVPAPGAARIARMVASALHERERVNDHLASEIEVLLL